MSSAIGVVAAPVGDDVAVQIDVTSSGADRIAVTGVAGVNAIAGGTTIGFMGASLPAVGTSYTIVEHAGSDAAPQFANLAEGAQVEIGGGLFAATYRGGNGNDLTITRLAPTTPVTTAPPEPAPPTRTTPPVVATPVIASAAEWVSVPASALRPLTRVRFNYRFTGNQPIYLTLYRAQDDSDAKQFIRRAYRTPSKDGTYGWSTITPGPGSYVLKIRTDQGRLLAKERITVG